MKRVCVLLRSLAPGGAEKQALLLAHALQEEHEPYLVLLSEEPRNTRHLAFIADHRIRTEFLPSNPLRKVARLRSFLNRERIDSLFCFLPSDTLIGALVGRCSRVRRVYGGLRNTRLRRHKEWSLRLVHNHVLDYTISNSHEAVRFFSGRGFQRDKFLVVPNGIFVRPPATPRPPSDVVHLMTVGRFVEEKDFHTALKSLRRVLDHNELRSQVRYLIVGCGPIEDRIRRWTGELGLQAEVELVIDPPDLEPLYAQADIYLSTSLYEGLSNSIMEAMNFGLPVVATNVGDNASLVKEGVNGYLAPIRDVEHLAKRLSELLRARELRMRYGAASHHILEQGYSFETLRQAYSKLLREEPTAQPGAI